MSLVVQQDEGLQTYVRFRSVLVYSFFDRWVVPQTKIPFHIYKASCLNPNSLNHERPKTTP